MLWEPSLYDRPGAPAALPPSLPPSPLQLGPPNAPMRGGKELCSDARSTTSLSPPLSDAGALAPLQRPPPSTAVKGFRARVGDSRGADADGAVARCAPAPAPLVCLTIVDRRHTWGEGSWGGRSRLRSKNGSKAVEVWPQARQVTSDRSRPPKVRCTTPSASGSSACRLEDSVITDASGVPSRAPSSTPVPLSRLKSVCICGCCGSTSGGCCCCGADCCRPEAGGCCC
mmetsp:Transcript_787/g.2406  ORF Transcript_787/g.2406 Transcript_787/m.2406 type:complete len:228 (-) Transcript_787:1177-1860(-)